MNLHLIDGMAYVHRAYHALPKLQRRDGLHCGAVHGFCSMLWHIITRPNDERTHLAVVMDGGHSGRDKIIADYKGNRREKDDELRQQYPYIDRACEAFSLPIAMVKGYEADDVIATLAQACTAQRGKTLIHSGDKDLMQLVDDHVSMFDPTSKRIISFAEVREKWSVEPHEIPCLLALTGDASDNVPGVPKVGKKTAAELVKAYGDLDAILDAGAANEITAVRLTAIQRANLAHPQIAADARKALKAVTLIRDVPMTIDFDQYVTQVRDFRPILDFFEEMEFDELTEQVIAQAA